MTVSKANHTNSNSGLQIEYKTDAKSLFSVTVDERKELARAAFEDGNRPAWQLLKMLGPLPCLYTLFWHYIGLSKDDAAGCLIYDPETIDKWKAAIRRHIKGPYFFCIEIGESGLIHAHVIAGYSAGLPKTIRSYSTKTVKIIRNTQSSRERVFKYLFKSSVRLTEDCDDPNAELLPDARERLDSYFQAVNELGKGNLPALRGFVF